MPRNGNFVLLWVGQFVSQVGDRLAMVAFPWLIYQRTGSAMSTGVILALYTLPYIFVGPFAGVVIDRADKRRLLIASDVVRAGLVVLVPLAASWNLTAVYGLALLVASVNVFFDPCKLALLPDVVEERQLLRANSVLATGETLTEVVGYATAGFALAWVSTATAFRIDAATFLVSAVAFILMRYQRPLREATEHATLSVRREIGEGLDFVRRHRGLLLNTLLVVVATLGIGATYPLTFFFAVDVLDGGTAAFGLFEASIAAGFLAGSLLLASVGRAGAEGLRDPRRPRGVLGAAVRGSSPSPTTVWVACIPFAVGGRRQRGRADRRRHVRAGDRARGAARPRLDHALHVHAGRLRVVGAGRRRTRRDRRHSPAARSGRGDHRRAGAARLLLTHAARSLTPA